MSSSGKCSYANTNEKQEKTGLNPKTMKQPNLGSIGGLEMKSREYRVLMTGQRWKAGRAQGILATIHYSEKLVQKTHGAKK